MTVQPNPRPAAVAEWELLFPITAAWVSACRDAGELWLNAVGETTRAFADLSSAQSTLFSDAMACSLGGLCGGALASEAAEATLHLVEDIGPGEGDYIPLPE